MKLKLYFIGLFMLLSNFIEANKYELSLCAIFHNEADFLREWVDFHKKMGVEHFWLYNHLSSDDYESEISDYIKDGSVEIIPWHISYENINEWNFVQCAAYNDCLKRSKNKTSWLIVIDTDEFIFPLKKKTIVEFLKDFKKESGIGVNWLMFGTSNFIKVPKGQMLKYLTWRANDDYSAHTHIKSIVRPECITHFENPHYGNYVAGKSQVNEDHVPFMLHLTPYRSTKKIRINHYWTRDGDFFLTKKIPRRQKWPGSKDLYIQMNEDLTKVLDQTIYIHLP